MSARAFVDGVEAAAARAAALAPTIEEAMAAERAANTHAGLVRSDGEILMSLGQMHRRLDRMEADSLDFAASLQAASHKAEERLRAWVLAGNVGRPPFGPLIPPRANATQADRRIWRLIAQGRARVIHIGHETDGTSPFRELSEIYELTDDALVTAINSHKSSEVWPPNGGVPA